MTARKIYKLDITVNEVRGEVRTEKDSDKQYLWPDRCLITVQFNVNPEELYNQVTLGRGSEDADISPGVMAALLKSVCVAYETMLSSILASATVDLANIIVDEQDTQRFLRSIIENAVKGIPASKRAIYEETDATMATSEVGEC